MFRLMKNTVSIAHEYLAAALFDGGTAVDATVGNGNDTLFLARLVGPEGRVYGFDIQEQAVRNTRELLEANGLAGVVELYRAGHEDMDRYVDRQVDAMVFNLGYLPGGDKGLVTQPESTLAAVSKGLALLSPRGIMCIVVYIGHEGGVQEQELLEGYLRGVDKKLYCVGKIDFLNRSGAPYLIVVEKSS